MSCYNNRTPTNGRQPLEVMSLDESETLLGAQYGSPTEVKFGPAQPCVTIVDLGVVPTLSSSVASHKQRLPSISSVAIPSPFTEQTTITSAGRVVFFVLFMMGTTSATIKYLKYLNTQ